jgi:serine phosphatase RsbU (regulator of sigma subunit)
MSTGGHPLPVVLRAGGRVELLGEPGSLLGALPHPALADRSAELAPGDALVLYTDGLTEAYAPERIVGEKELADAVQACAGRNATAIAAGLRHALLDDANGREPRDDIVLLVIRVPPA